MKTGLGGKLFYKFPDELSPVGGYVVWTVKANLL